MTLLTTSLHYNSQSHLIHSYSDSKNFKKYDWAILGTNILLMMLYKYKINNTVNCKLHVLVVVQVVLVGISPASFSFNSESESDPRTSHKRSRAPVLFTISVSIMDIKNF